MQRVELEPVNPTPRRFPRTLKDAFPVSENRRAAIETPPPPSRLDRLCWPVAIAMLLYLAWAVLNAPAPH